MIAWLIGNLGNIFIILLLILIVVAIIVSLIRDKKRGISHCGGNCAHCGICSSCKRPEKDPSAGSGSFEEQAQANRAALEKALKEQAERKNSRSGR